MPLSPAAVFATKEIIMSSRTISLIVFASVLGGAVLGLFLRTVLPEDRLSRDSKDLVMNMVVGLMAVMVALVLGLVISSAMDSYTEQKSEIEEVSTQIILLDRIMAHYGLETMEIRDMLRQSVGTALNEIWPENGSRPARLESTPGSEGLYDKIQDLSPQNEIQRSLKTQALEIGTRLAQKRWLMAEQSGRSIPMEFMLMLVFWLTITFVSFGLFTPDNKTVIAILIFCVVSVTFAVFLILELDQPFDGLIQVSSDPMRNALSHLGKKGW